jgi:phosphoglucosamine mutase
MSNMGLGRALESHGIRLERTQVGDRYVVERMRQGGFNFGGEQSGHLVFLDHATTGDGLVAALQVLNVMRSRQRPLSELADVMTRYPQVLISRYVMSKPPIETLPTVQQVVRSVEQRLGRDGRVVLRYSGTEAKVRVMIEGSDDTVIRNAADEIVDAFGQDVGFASSNGH